MRLGGSAVIGATGRLGCDPWDGVARLAGHELGEGESEQRERKRVENGQGVAGGVGGGGWLGMVGRQRVKSREQRMRSRAPRVFWRKMVYEIFFRKPFSFFSFAFLRSNTNVFLLTFILRRNKRLQMLKMFYGKRFQPKQTEP
jgi:hypothetical protein